MPSCKKCKALAGRMASAGYPNVEAILAKLADSSEVCTKCQEAKQIIAAVGFDSVQQLADQYGSVADQLVQAWADNLPVPSSPSLEESLPAAPASAQNTEAYDLDMLGALERKLEKKLEEHKLKVEEDNREWEEKQALERQEHQRKMEKLALERQEHQRKMEKLDCERLEHQRKMEEKLVLNRKEFEKKLDQQKKDTRRLEEKLGNDRRMAEKKFEKMHGDLDGVKDKLDGVKAELEGFVRDLASTRAAAEKDALFAGGARLQNAAFHVLKIIDGSNHLEDEGPRRLRSTFKDKCSDDQQFRSFLSETLGARTEEAQQKISNQWDLILKSGVDTVLPLSEELLAAEIRVLVDLIDRHPILKRKYSFQVNVVRHYSAIKASRIGNFGTL